MDKPTPVLMNRLRATARRRGWILTQSRRRDALAVDFGKFRLVVAATGEAAVGGAGFTLSVADVEAALARKRP